MAGSRPCEVGKRGMVASSGTSGKRESARARNRNGSRGLLNDETSEKNADSVYLGGQ